MQRVQRKCFAPFVIHFAPFVIHFVLFVIRFVLFVIRFAPFVLNEFGHSFFLAVMPGRDMESFQPWPDGYALRGLGFVQDVFFY
jgi:hypothetical protein